jgi:DNA-binding CsgD family transcriptional regulator
VPSDIYSVTEVVSGNGHAAVTGTMEPEDQYRISFASWSECKQALERHASEHPLRMLDFRKGYEPVEKISDFLSAPDFHDTGLYTEFYRKLRVEDQIVLKVRTVSGNRGCGAGIALSRGSRTFSEQHRQRLNRLAPHVVQAYRNAERVTMLEQLNSAPADALAAAMETLGVGRRETEVLMAAASGLTNKGVAAALGISPLTVKKHLEHTYAKLGVENRSSAVSRVLRSLGFELAALPPNP